MESDIVMAAGTGIKLYCGISCPSASFRGVRKSAYADLRTCPESITPGGVVDAPCRNCRPVVMDSGLGALRSRPRNDGRRAVYHAVQLNERKQLQHLQPLRESAFRQESRISMSPLTIISAATMRIRRSGSLRNTIANTDPNRTLVSRTAATTAIGATVIAQIAMP
jgi:hypothetical protein